MPKHTTWFLVVASVALMFTGYCTMQRKDNIPTSTSVAYNPVTKAPYTKDESDSLIELYGKRSPEIAVLGAIMLLAGLVGLITAFAQPRSTDAAVKN